MTAAFLAIVAVTYAPVVVFFIGLGAVTKRRRQIASNQFLEAALAYQGAPTPAPIKSVTGV